MPNTELNELSVKDLRQLATEHQVPGRSKLTKDALIDTLKQVLAKRSESPSKPAAAKKKPAEKTTNKKKTDKKSEKTKAADKSNDKKKNAEKTEDKSGKKSTAKKQIVLDASIAEKTNDKNNDETPDDGKRRRRRRGGRGRRRQDDNEQNDNTAPEQQDEKAIAEKASEADSKATTETAKEKQPEQAGRQPHDRRQRPERREREDNRRERDDRRNRRDDRGRDSRRPPAPRLEGKQRRLPPMHERLVAFCEGVVELCDPETPSWAQARLSELLAEAGLAPIPCVGTAHPDFHEIVNSVESTEHEAGHIVSIEAPGFCVRGDRGSRLFPIRKAKVTVAAGDVIEVDAKNAEADEKKPQSEEKSQELKTETAVENEAVAEAEPVKKSRALKKEKADAHEAENPDKTQEEAPPNEKTSRAKKERSRKQNKDTCASLPLRAPKDIELSEKDTEQTAAFAELGLGKEILSALAQMGFEKPSPIQAQSIPVALSGRDIFGQAQTGTGKTAAFTLPLLQQLYKWEGNGPVAIVLCPTRELARQVHAEFIRMAAKSQAYAALVYGGVRMDNQIDDLQRNPHVVIGTPGRIIDHIKRQHLDCSGIKQIILDEADQMLDIGFLPDIEFILKQLPIERQTQLFSATLPSEIKGLIEKYQRDPEHIHIAPDVVAAKDVDQKYIAVDANKKTDLLAHYIEQEKPEQLVVFCRMKSQVDRVARILKSKDMIAAAIHGDLPQNKREQTLKKFRDGSLSCLIATNVAARGLDIPSVSHVINYDIPENPDEYVHRIGRTGRMGAKGFARTFISPDDGPFLLEIEKYIGFELPEETVDGITASTAGEAKRTIGSMVVNGPRILKPLVGGIRLGRRGKKR